MTRSTINFFFDLFLAGLFLSMLTIVGIVHLTFPSAAEAGGWTVWGLSYETWYDLELFAMIIFAVCVIVHLILHWTWIYGFVTSRLARHFHTQASRAGSVKTLYGVMTLIIILTVLGGILLAAEFSAQPPATTSL